MDFPMKSVKFNLNLMSCLSIFIERFFFILREIFTSSLL